MKVFVLFESLMVMEVLQTLDPKVLTILPKNRVNLVFFNFFVNLPKELCALCKRVHASFAKCK